jgi:hypothetical protein
MWRFASSPGSQPCISVCLIAPVTELTRRTQHFSLIWKPCEWPCYARWMQYFSSKIVHTRYISSHYLYYDLLCAFKSVGLLIFDYV